MADNDAHSGDRGQAATGGRRSSSSQKVSQEIIYRGVYANGRKFSATVVGTPLPNYVGCYATPEEAAKAHDEAALERLGNEATLNFLPNGQLNPNRLASRLSARKTSTFKGVSAIKKGWIASYCAHAGWTHYLGSFAGEEDAARAYDKYAKERDKDFAILNFLPDGSINPYRHHLRGRRRQAMAATPAEGGVGHATVSTKQQQKQKEAEGVPRKLRRLNEDLIIDLTQDEPMQAIAPSASDQTPTRVSVRAVASYGRRATAAGGGGGPAASTQPLCRSTLPKPTSSSASRVKVEAVPAVPLPACPPGVKVEASAAVSSSSSAAQSMAGNGLKMTPTQATALLGAEAFRRLATCEEGSDQMTSLERLVELLPQLCREGRDASAHFSSSSSASSGSSHADLRAFLLTSVCPRYTTEELADSHLDNVMQISLCMVKL